MFMMIECKPTQCRFYETFYNGKILYSMLTVLVGKDLKILFGKDTKDYYLYLGENLNYVKKLARRLDKNTKSFDVPVYLKKELYKSNEPFYIRDEFNTLLNVHYHYNCEIETLGYLEKDINDKDIFSYFRHNGAKNIFDYRVRSKYYILARKNDGTWKTKEEIIKESQTIIRYERKELKLAELLMY